MSVHYVGIERVNELRGCLSHLRRESGQRRREDDEDLFKMTDPFASDKARIMLSKAFRLLAHKTQVLTGPENPFIRTRLSHVMEVVGISLVVADMLGLNRSLVEAIALCHDIGHVPYGHPGENFLAKRMGKNGIFCHEVLGPIVMEKIERLGKGLNLTYETLEGAMCHSGNKAYDGMTQEAWVVRYVDKIAYLTADYNDITKSSRMAYPVPRELEDMMDSLGSTHRERVTSLMTGLIVESEGAGKVSFEHSEFGKTFAEIRRMMNKIYPKVTEQNLESTIDPLLEFLRGLDLGNEYLLFSLLTDEDVQMLRSIETRNITHLKNTALAERIGYLKGLGDIDLCDPGLNW